MVIGDVLRNHVEKSMSFKKKDGSRFADDKTFFKGADFSPRGVNNKSPKARRRVQEDRYDTGCVWPFYIDIEPTSTSHSLAFHGTLPDLIDKSSLSSSLQVETI